MHFTPLLALAVLATASPLNTLKERDGASIDAALNALYPIQNTLAAEIGAFDGANATLADAITANTASLETALTNVVTVVTASGALTADESSSVSKTAQSLIPGANSTLATLISLKPKFDAYGKGYTANIEASLIRQKKSVDAANDAMFPKLTAQYRVFKTIVESVIDQNYQKAIDVYAS
jgi:hypothetical protein